MDFFDNLPSTSQSSPENGQDSQMIQPGRVKQTRKDFFDNLPSTSQSSPENRQDSQMVRTGDRDHDSRGNSLSVSMTEIQEQHTSSSIDDVSRRVQELVEKINDSRTSDQKVMDSFQEKLVNEVKDICHQMKELMFAVYEENSSKMQMKLQELSDVLESCTKLNNELQEASKALASLRKGLTISQTSDP